MAMTRDPPAGIAWLTIAVLIILCAIGLLSYRVALWMLIG